MKYQVPEVMALAPAINAIQDKKNGVGTDDPIDQKEPPSAYADWED
jgi:hypothetical protein